MATAQYFHFEDDGAIPNNPILNVVFYPEAFIEDIDRMEEVFNRNNWLNSWKGGIYDFHHYHSNTHEVIGVCAGSATLQLGGEQGEQIKVKAGDVAVLPAGTGHKKIGASDDFQVIGAYPDGVSYNLKTGEPGERPYVLEDIQNVPMPRTDPVYGKTGPLLETWI